MEHTMTTAYESQIDAILRHDPAAAVQRVQSRVDELLDRANRSVVLFGAGRLGQHVLPRLRGTGVRVLAFADNNPRLWGKEVEGVEVLEPREAVRRFAGSAVFVVTVYTNGPVLRQAQELGAPTLKFAELAWRFPDALLPHGCLEHPHKLVEQQDDVRRAAGLWADDASRREYLGQLEWRFSLDRACLPPAVDPRDTYFPDELIRSLAEEVFVDCGAFDGDSVRDFLKRRRGVCGKIVALEPDPLNCGRLRAFLPSLPTNVAEKITVLQNAVGRRRETDRFNATGTAGSSVGAGEYEVEVVPLDEALANERPTYIKMDIEGAEPDAILGASRTIAESAPVLAICLYHAQEHLWQIPLMLRSLQERYRFFLRRYSDECWEQVCYAVPAERLR
jgi:FkbM family methyltransferase